MKAFLLAAILLNPPAAFAENPYLGDGARPAEKPLIARAPVVRAIDPDKLTPVRIPSSGGGEPPEENIFRPSLFISDMPSFAPGSAHDLSSSVFGDVTAGYGDGGVLLKVEKKHCEDAKLFFKDAVASEWRPGTEMSEPGRKSAEADKLFDGCCWLLLKGWDLAGSGDSYVLRRSPPPAAESPVDAVKKKTKKEARNGSSTAPGLVETKKAKPSVAAKPPTAGLKQESIPRKVSPFL